MDGEVRLPRRVLRAILFRQSVQASDCLTAGHAPEAFMDAGVRVHYCRRCGVDLVMTG